jgi:acyl carrier protein
MSTNTVDGILEQVNGIFKDVLDNDDIVVYSTSTADDIEEWDSLSHIQLVVAVEKHFKIRFTAAEINSFKNVGEMCEGILKKING